MILPDAFVTYTRVLMGEKLYQQLEEGLVKEAPTSIRVNPFKIPKDISLPGELVPWCPMTGRYLSMRHAFTFDPWLHAGMYYVQEASSMFIDLVIRQQVHHPVMMLDLCAAPGGKSTAIRAALPEGSLLFSNEPMRTRAQILAENIQKFGHPDVIVTNNYPRDYKKSKLQFDVILTDVPCSGEGMFRKDEGAVQEWSVQNVENCWHLQREIVSDIWSCLKPGGLLIYSTCTFNAHEDEENVAWIAEELGAEFVSLDIEEEWQITSSLVDNHPVYRFVPGKTRGEGLFLAVLRKEGESSPWKGKDNEDFISHRSSKKQKKQKKDKETQSVSCPEYWLKDSDMLMTDVDDSTAFAIPMHMTEAYHTARKSLKVLHAGVKVGVVKGKDFIPDQSLALSILLKRDAFPRVELSYEEAIRFLRKEAVVLPPDTPRGYTIVTYRGVPLGFEKNIGNRANNLYPTEWKIKSSHVPKGAHDLL